MVSFLARLNDADYAALVALAAAEQLPRIEIIRRLIRLGAIQRRLEEQQQALHREIYQREGKS